MIVDGIPETPEETSKRIQRVFEEHPDPKSIERWIEHVGEGWRPLVRELDANLRDIAPDYVIGQVKEKFGGLRFYLDAFPEQDYDRARKLIEAAEELSFKTCENCGMAGEPCKANAFWIRTLCPLCQKRSAEKHASDHDD
jgi:hypothetical protein